jgi:LuxR family transcriptional regulator, maltose regulon positive regulatory protein
MALARALTLAAPEGYVRMFVDEGAPMRLLIADCRPILSGLEGSQIAQGTYSIASHDRQRLPAYMDTLLTALHGTAGGGLRAEDRPQRLSVLSPPPAALVEPLSTREIEILRLIADGHSNQAIADMLIIAVSTVKRHINNIYGKLDVQSRTQALVRARELNVL